MVTRSGLTENDFHCEFATAEDGYLAAFDHGLALLATILSRAVPSGESWLTRARVATRTLLSFLDREPGWARLLLVEPPAVGPRALQRRQRALESLTRLLYREAPTQSGEDSFALSSELLAELVVGGVFSAVHARIVRGEDRSLADLTPSLMSMVVLPYLGSEAASEELTRAPAPLQAQPPQQSIGQQPTRTTRRTILVLQAIAASPHSSNRDVAAAAGLRDEGQTSKLLQRLQRLGLIENVGLGQAHGEPNAWLLTNAGQQLMRAAADGARQATPEPQAQARAQLRTRRSRRTCQEGSK